MTVSNTSSLKTTAFVTFEETVIRIEYHDGWQAQVEELALAEQSLLRFILLRICQQGITEICFRDKDTAALAIRIRRLEPILGAKTELRIIK